MAASNQLEQRFTLEEAGPLLTTLSKLHPVVIVSDSPYFHPRFPHICWIDAEPFRVLDGVISQYPGSGQWHILRQVPRRCLIVEPNPEKGEAIPLEPNLWTAAAEEFAQAVRLAKQRNIELPFRQPHFVDPGEYKARMAGEVTELARFIEGSLSLRGKPSLGVASSHEELELPLMEDQDGPGGGVVLAADPLAYVRTGLATSTHDRFLHFWITDEESLELWSEVSKSGAGDLQGNPGWPLLAKVSGAGHGGLLLRPEDVPNLAAESARLKERADSDTLRPALDRILSACRSAINYHLGMYLEGD